MTKKVSIIIATHNRKKTLHNLIEHLENQSHPKENLEIIITDDGSSPGVTLKELEKSSLHVKLISQENKGQASARNRAIKNSKGDVIVIIDDDMVPCFNFIESHLAKIDAGHNVSFGKIENKENQSLPSFEKYHLLSLQKKYSKYESGFTPLGTSLCTGNVAFTAELFRQTMGFDESLKRSEDREIGIQLQTHGAKFGFSKEALTIHQSDHRSAKNWRHKAKLYGIYDSIIAKKHSNEKWASPWNFITESNPIKVIFIANIITPSNLPLKNKVTHLLDAVIGSNKTGKIGEIAASITYPYAYISGVTSFHGKKNSIKLLLKHRFENLYVAAFELIDRINADLNQSAEKTYRYKGFRPKKLTMITHKVGLQVIILFRFIQFFNRVKLPQLSKYLSRTIRFMYGSDIHPQTQIKEGISIVHGFGIVTSSETKIGRGSIIFQNVTLGMGRDKITGKSGSPNIGENVHIGPGASITGPFNIGNNTKISGGVTISQDIPENSVVYPPLNRIIQKNKQQNEREKK